jgi:hypothetical protein
VSDATAVEPSKLVGSSEMDALVDPYVHHFLLDLRDPAPQSGPEPDTEDISLQLSPFLLGLCQDPRWHAILR